MNRRNFIKSVSASALLAAGTMSGISRVFAADKSQQERINNDGLTPIRHAYESGITLFDTAEI